MEKNYLARSIDVALLEWKESPLRKPLLVRGARQVGKSSSVRHLGETFKYFLEVNLERNPDSMIIMMFLLFQVRLFSFWMRYRGVRM